VISTQITDDDRRTRTDKIATTAEAEVMKDAVAMLLVHPRVNVETRVAEFRDLLSKQLNSLCSITEDDRLVDLQLMSVTNTATHLLIHTAEQSCINT